MNVCVIEDCECEQYARSYCLRHYRRCRKYGDPIDLRKMKRRPADVTLEEWFWSRVDKQSEGCWIWTAAHHSGGYGQISDGEKIAYAHRLAYEFTKGKIDEGLVIDHTCRVRDCVNPEHLQVTTHKVNMENVVNNLGSASGVRGVHKLKSRNKWRASVGHNGVRYVGGEFATIEEAERAAISLRNQLFTNNLPDRVA